MPGLNQLKQFADDIRKVGDEEKIRAQRGEKPASIPFPKGISEADDSNDFIIGMPSKDDMESKDENSVSSPTDEISDILDTESADLDPDIQALLNPTASADEDALADFLNDSLESPENVSSSTASPAQEIEELANPEGDLGNIELDSILNPNTESDSSSVSDILDNPDLPPAEPDLSGLGELSDLAVSGALDMEPGMDNSAPAPADEGEINDLPDLGNIDTTDIHDIPETDSAEASLGTDTGDFNMDSLNMDSLMDNLPGDESLKETADSTNSSDVTDNAGGSDTDLPDMSLSDLDLNDMSMPDMSEMNFSDIEAPSSESESVAPVDDAEIPLGDDDALSALNAASADAGAAPSSDGFDFNTDIMDAPSLGEIDDISGMGEAPLPTDEIPDTFTDEHNAENNPASEKSEGDSIESFDTSGMDGVDFGSPSDSGDEFPATDDSFGGDDDFVLDSSFEIPGFSDTETADLGKKKPLLDTVDFSDAKEDRPRNSLTDDEYAQFKKNLSNYPLNLRIALEDFITRDEFTDEAVFEIIEKVLKKTSARQLATQLEKLLDISINIPRDFERRSFAEYEAYKQSFQYQLKNRIIPAAIVGVILCFVCFGLFKAGQHFIYEPVMANMHYKQGYTLLEANEFPQSEDEFIQAVKYRPVKKWFFKYALGYRNKKQFERAGQMYKRILRYFNHDKQAGLDYAAMELYDRANYERAEEIVRREVLDYHINDADGILMLGDVFLEWAEIAPEKYELAKEQYLDLLQRYGSNNTYLARMLRYNIRTDKLREVLYYKNIFYQSKNDKQNLKNLEAEDWTELSGYMLEKLYGTLSKNDEYLRSSIEDVLAMLNLAIKASPANPVARYNLAQYFIQNGNTEQAKHELEHSLDLFEKVPVRTRKNVYREINATRILGELYAANREYLKAQTVYTRGINIYNEEHESSELEGDENTGKLFADMGDLDYFISGEMDDALYNYEKAIEIKNDTPSINYRVGAIYYNRKNYDNALSSFLKVAEKQPHNPNILLSLGNVLSLRGDNFAAESYYADLIRVLDQGREKQKFLLPQSDDDDYAVVDLYLKANNNLGVTLYRLARQTGNSNKNAESIVRLSDSIRAWDALTRNQKTMIRMEGSNLAAQNSKYITHPLPEFEPAIYTDIPRLLAGEKGLE